MPVKNTIFKETTLAAHKQLSYENLVTAWLMSDGWEILIPAIDHGKKTDLVVADDSNFYRIQVKKVLSLKRSQFGLRICGKGKYRLRYLLFASG